LSPGQRKSPAREGSETGLVGFWGRKKNDSLLDVLTKRMRAMFPQFANGVSMARTRR